MPAVGNGTAIAGRRGPFLTPVVRFAVPPKKMCVTTLTSGYAVVMASIPETVRKETYNVAGMGH